MIKERLYFDPKLLFAALLTCSAYVAQAQIPAPLVYFDFEGDSETLTDKSYNVGNYEGTIIDLVSIEDGGAPSGASPGKAGRFEGGWVSVPNFDMVENLHGSNYTLACWLKPDFDALVGGSFIFGQRVQGIHNGVRVHDSNGGLPALHTAHWGADGSADTELVEDEWVHAVWTYDADDATANIYLNGEVDLEDFGQNPPNGSGNLFIGTRNGGDAGNVFTGDLDEIAIWDTILTQEQITALADGTAAIDQGDTDEDNLPDAYEQARAGNLTDLNGVGDADFDMDGLSDLAEFTTHNTNPAMADTDGDTLSDGDELAGAGDRPATDPLDDDTDGDGLSDLAENNSGTFVDEDATGTDPTKEDSDSDSFSDGVEVAQGSDPTDEDSTPGSALPPPLVYFDFEGDSIDLISDKSGNDRNGEVNGEIELTEGAPQGSTPGQGGVFSLNGASFLDVPDFDWFELVHADGDDRLGSYTLSCWLKPDGVSLSGDRFIWGQTTQGVHNGLRGSGTLHTAHWGSDFNADTPLEEEEWVQAVWTYDGDLAEAHIYLNGELDGGPFAQNPPNGSGNLIIGGRNGGTQNFVGTLDELAIWNEVLREDQIEVLAQGGSPVGATQEDSDGDGMTDSYEERNELNPDVDDAAEDKDGDGLTNLEEFMRFLKANDPDTDGDTLNDKVESGTGVYVSAEDTGTNPLSADTDRDGLTDGVETNTGVFVSATDRGTDPHKADTDGDMFEDGREVDLETDPLDPNSVPPIPPLGPDLIGMDLTDPEDDGDPENDDGYNAVFAASEEEGFGGGESAFNVFDNIVGGGNDKWCCGSDGNFPDEPIWVQATFEDPIVLGMFSIASANDTPGRDPLIWEIQGSNDGENFDTIFRQEDEVQVWEERNQVAVFTEGTHFDRPGAYTTIRFICFETGLTSGARFQIGELEFFGAVGSVGPFQIESVNRISRDGSEFLQITWPSRANGSYTIETGMDLNLDWSEVEDGVESQGETTTYELMLADPVPSELYIRVTEEG